MKRLLSAAVLTLLLVSAAAAQARLAADTAVSGQVEQGAFSTKELFDLSAATGPVDLVSSLSINSDGKYGADIANFRDTHSLFNTYYLMEQGYVGLNFSPVTFKIGRMLQKDAFESPYSLFINSQNPSTVGAVFQYKDSFFTYESRWIRLSDRSDMGDGAPPAWSSANGQSNSFPDRGANIKTLTLTLGKQKFGIQDAGVYTNRSFDLEYFVSPVPEYFTQYFYGTSGRPWTTNSNENNLIGFFWAWDDDRFRIGAQVLIDDFSLYFLLPSLVPNNPWKAAWTAGGEVDTWAGTFGLFHAGALKYTFEPIDASLGHEADAAYGYTLYPDTRYGLNSSTLRAFTIEDNALGYLHGENNLAVMLTWSNAFSRSLSVASQVEFLLAGANSPANPWQDAIGSFEVGTHWIDDPVLQQSVVWTTKASWKLGDWELFGTVKLGGVWHELELVTADYPAGTISNLDKYVQIYKPSNTNRAIGALMVGVSYHADLTRLFTGK